MERQTQQKQKPTKTGNTNTPFFRGRPVQRKLKVGAPNDRYEKEADAMADKVMRMPAKNTTQEKTFFNPAPALGRLQRQCTQCREEEKKLHRKPLASDISPVVQRSGSGEATVSPQVEANLQSTKGSGRALPGNTQSFMENRFGTDFSGVNIHTDARSHQLNQQLGAWAFTHGNDIYFNRGEYNLNSGSGKHLLAHELTHVVQQGNFTLIGIGADAVWAHELTHVLQQGNSQNGSLALKVRSKKQSYTAKEIESMVQTAKEIGRTRRKQLMKKIGKRVGINDLHKAWKMFAGSELRIYKNLILPLTQEKRRRKGASINLNRLQDLSQISIPISLTMVTSYRENYPYSIWTHSKKKIKTFEFGGLDFLGKNMDRLPLPKKVTKNWKKDRPGISRETHNMVYPGIIPKRDAILGYAAQTQLSYATFKAIVERVGGDKSETKKALDQLSYEAKLIWMALAFLAPGGKDYKGKNSQRSWGTKTTVQYLSKQAKKNNDVLNLNNIIIDSTLAKMTRIKSAKTRAAEALFIEKLPKIAEERKKNFNEFQKELYLQSSGILV